jgi:hypothetical protein
MTIRNVLSTTSDVPGISAGLVDRSEADKDILILRGLEAGPGLQIDVVDFDQSIYATRQKKIVIRATTDGSGGVFGEINTASNIGAGAGLFAAKSGSDLRFKSLRSGDGVTLTESGQEITIGTTAVSDVVTLGSGTSLFDAKLGTTLQAKSLAVGSNITLTDINGTIQIATTAQNNAGKMLGVADPETAAIYAGMSGSDLTFRRLVAGAGITFAESPETITITAAGGDGGSAEITTASNVGSGMGLFAQKLLSDLQFRSLRAGSNVTLTATATDITIDTTGDLTDAANRGTPHAQRAEVYYGKTGTVLEYRRLAADGAISLSQTDDLIIISAPPAGEINTGSNLGTTADGGALYVNNTGTALTFRRIKAGSGVSVVETGTSVTVSSTIVPGILNLVEDTSPQLGGDLDVQSHGIVSSAGRDIVVQADGMGRIVLDGLRWPNTDGSAGQVLSTNGTGELVWANPIVGSGSGEVVGAANVGTAGIGVYDSEAAGVLNFRRINAGSTKISVVHEVTANEVRIDVDQSALDLSLMGGTLDIASGGTGGTTPATARSNLGLGTLATQNTGSVQITGGAINGTLIGGTTAAAATFTDLTATGTVVLDGSQWPTGTGTSGQVLTTDGAGSLAWTTVTGGGGDGETNDGTNVGTAGAEVYAGKLAASLQFRRLNAGSNKVTVAHDATSNEIRFDIDQTKLSLGSLGGSTTVAQGGTGRSTFTTNAVLIGGAAGIEQTVVPQAATPAYLKWNGTTFLWDSPAAGGDVTGAANLGSGQGLYAAKSGANLQFKSLTAGTAITLTGNADDVAIAVNQGSLDLNSIGTAHLGVAKGGTGATTLTEGGVLIGHGTGAITATAAPTVTDTFLKWSSSTGYQWSSTPAGSGEANTASNQGSGSQVYLTKSGVELQFRTLAAGSTKMTVAQSGNLINFDVAESVLNIANMGGNLTVGRGGTGATTFTDNGVLIGHGTGAVTATPAPSSTGQVLTYNGSNSFTWTTPSTGSGAPADAQYLVLVADGTLTNERVLTLGTGLTRTDGGAGGNYALSVSDNSTTQKVEVAANGTTVTNPRKKINFIAGSNVTLSAADDAANDRVNVTINATAATPAGGGGAFTGPFVVNITAGSGGLIGAINSVPSGWTVTGVNTATLTVSSHNVGLEPRTVVFRGNQSASAIRVIPMIASSGHYIGLAAGTETSAFTIVGLSLTAMGAAAGQPCQIHIYF